MVLDCPLFSWSVLSQPLREMPMIMSPKTENCTHRPVCDLLYIEGKTICLEYSLPWHDHHCYEWWIVIHPTWQLAPTDLWSTYNVSRLNVCIFRGDTWSVVAHELDISCIISHPIVSAKLYAWKQFYLGLHCIELSAELLSGVDFALPHGTVSEVLFPW